jgi:hypothetical protein
MDARAAFQPPMPGHTPRGRFQRAIHAGTFRTRRMAAREMGGLSLADALMLCELLANPDPARNDRGALRRLQRFIDERLPPLTEVALAASALAELPHYWRNVGVEALKDSPPKMTGEVLPDWAKGVRRTAGRPPDVYRPHFE